MKLLATLEVPEKVAVARLHDLCEALATIERDLADEPVEVTWWRDPCAYRTHYEFRAEDTARLAVTAAITPLVVLLMESA